MTCGRSSRRAPRRFYLENPGFLGAIEVHAAEIAATAREAGAETIVGVDPISLGVLAPPGAYGADIVVGSIQPLGVHMSPAEEPAASSPPATSRATRTNTRR